MQSQADHGNLATNSRYTVEMQLGPADNSHSLRAIRHWALGLLALALVLMAIISWLEPVWGDGWFFQAAQQATPTPALHRVWWSNYQHGNPRLGETLAWWLYELGPWHALPTTLLTLCVAWLLAVIALGRRPTRHDALMLSAIIAMMLAALPQSGRALFYRPLHANYIAGAIPTLGLLALASWHLRSTVPRRMYASVALGLGGVAGICNEHTGPASVALLIGCAWVAQRRGRPYGWLVVASLGIMLGTLVLLTAPGQAMRYGGIGKVSIWVTIGSRTWLQSARIIATPSVFAVALLPWLVIGFARHALRTELTRRIGVGFAAGACVLVGATLLGSPMQGARLALFPIMLMIAAAAMQLTALPPRRQAALLFVNALVIVGLGGLQVWATMRLHAAYATRMAQLASARPGSALTVAPMPTTWAWLMRSDDFLDAPIRDHVANMYQLTSLHLAQPLRPSN